MRFAICGLVVGLASSAFASFDLVLVADAGLGVVHRYDGDSGAYLGNFGTGDLVGCYSISIKQNLGRAYIGMPNGVYIYDYNTGEVLGSTDIIGGRGVATSNTGVLVANGGTGLAHLNSLSSASSYTTYVSPSADVLIYSGVDSTGDYLGFGSASGRLSRWNPAVTASPESSIVDTGLIGHAGFAISGTTMLTISPTGTAHSKNTQLLGSSSSVGFNLATPWTTALDIEFAHSGWAFGLGKIGASIRLQRYRQSGGGVGAYYDPFGASRTLTQPTNPVSIAIVAAPEPGSLAALAVASLVLLRRRR